MEENSYLCSVNYLPVKQDKGGEKGICLLFSFISSDSGNAQGHLSSFSSVEAELPSG